MDSPPENTLEGAEPKALVPALPKELLEPPKAPNPAAGFAAKGEALFEAATQEIASYVEELRSMPIPKRKDHH